MTDILTWNIYEITTSESPIHGVKLRGRIRKFGIDQGFKVLAENATDKENCVRYAVLDNEHGKELATFIKNLIKDSEVMLIEEGVQNPVLSKMLVNYVERYTL